jgi:hypothetical protein
MTAGAYGQARKPKARRWSGTDRRYSTYRWRVKTRLPVLRRDGWRCWVSGCERRGDVADHIDPVGPFTTDAEFFDQSRIRASCRGHNLGRGFIGAEHEEQFGMIDRRRRPAARTAVITRDYTRPRTW